VHKGEKKDDNNGYNNNNNSNKDPIRMMGKKNVLPRA
jgi:hypothetical protein